MWGRPGAFYATGAIGFVWLAAWRMFYARGPHPRLIRMGQGRNSAVPWRRLASFRRDRERLLQFRPAAGRRSVSAGRKTATPGCAPAAVLPRLHNLWLAGAELKSRAG